MRGCQNPSAALASSAAMRDKEEQKMKSLTLDAIGKSVRSMVLRYARSLRHTMLVAISISVTGVASAGTLPGKEQAVGDSLLAGAYLGRPTGHVRLMKRRHTQNTSSTATADVVEQKNGHAKDAGTRPPCRSKRAICSRFGRYRPVSAVHTKSYQEGTVQRCRHLRYRPRPVRHRC